MADTGRLESDPLFLGLTRPAMMLGVTYLWFMLNAMLCTIYFINTSDFIRLVPSAIIIHLIGYFICMKEPRYMEIMMTKASKCMRCRNTIFHGHTHSYDMY